MDWSEEIVEQTDFCDLDKNYTQLLRFDGNLDLQTVFLLDKVQKHEMISKEGYNEIKKLGLVEGSYPNVFVSYKVADMEEQQTKYFTGNESRRYMADVEGTGHVARWYLTRKGFLD